MMLPFYLLIAVMPLVRHQFWSLTSLAGLSMNKWLGLAALITACFHLTMRRTAPRPFRTPQAVLFVLFGIAVILSFLLRGPEKAAVELSPVGNWVSFLVLFFMIVVFLDSRRRFKWTLFAAIGGVAFTSLHLLREWQGYGGMTAGVRPGWVAGDPNYFAVSALTCLPLAFLFSEVRLPPWQRIAIRTCLVVMLVAFVLAASRGGMLGLITSLAFVAFRSRRRSQYLAVGGTVLLVLLLISPTSPLRRTFDPGQAEMSSTLAHETLLWAGLRMFRENALVGVGVGNFKHVLDQYLGPNDPDVRHVAHNTFLEVGSELGVPGLLLLLAILFYTFHTLRRTRLATSHGRDPLLHLAARGIEAGLAGTCVAMLFVSALHSRLFWFLVIVAMCLPSIPAAARYRPPRVLPPLPTSPEGGAL
jgi:O-antigen ligase